MDLVLVTFTINALMRAPKERKGAQGKRPQQALALLSYMQRQDVMPDIFTYSTLLSACDEGKQPE